MRLANTRVLVTEGRNLLGAAGRLLGSLPVLATSAPTAASRARAIPAGGLAALLGRAGRATTVVAGCSALRALLALAAALLGIAAGVIGTPAAIVRSPTVLAATFRALPALVTLVTKIALLALRAPVAVTTTTTAAAAAAAVTLVAPPSTVLAAGAATVLALRLGRCSRPGLDVRRDRLTRLARQPAEQACEQSGLARSACRCEGSGLGGRLG